MKRKNQSELKSAKMFEFNDVFIYSAILLVVLILFFSFVIFPAKATGVGFEVFKGEKVALTYYSDSKSVKISPEFQNLIAIEEKETQIDVTIFVDESKTSFNVITFSKEKGDAKITKSTCHSKDCTLFPAVKNSGVIYCDPHGVKIVPIGSGGFTPPVTG